MIKRLAHYADFLLGMRWKFVVTLFLVGLCMRTVVFRGDHREGDELIYMSLVAQLDAGRGYTLHGSPILERGIIDKDEYDHPLFFHPPGGIVLDWLFYEIFGRYGFPLVQMFSYALFFWSMMLLADSLKLLSTNTGMGLVAALSAFNPIMAHVTTKFWLDGPLLGFTTLAVTVFAWAVTHNKRGWGLVSGLLLGFASLIKVVAFLVIPGVVLMAWFLLKTHSKPTKKSRKQPSQLAKFVRFVILLLVPALLLQLPWEIWQWIACGSPFPGWAGKPSATLIATNRYVYYLTVARPPWVYLTLTVRVLWTLIPAALLYILLWKNKSVRWLGLSLIIWILTVILCHVALGYWGYSKLLRYIILATPASVILFALLLNEAVESIKNSGIASNINRVTLALVLVSVLALFMEMAAGTYATVLYQKALIIPILGEFY